MDLFEEFSNKKLQTLSLLKSTSHLWFCFCIKSSMKERIESLFVCLHSVTYNISATEYDPIWPFASKCRFKILAILVWICDLLELFESVFLEFFSNSKKWITHLFTIRDQFIYKLFGHDDLYFHITIFTNGL